MGELLTSFGIRDTAVGDTGTASPRGEFSWTADGFQAVDAFDDARGLRATDLFNTAFALLIHRYSGQDDIVLAWADGRTGTHALPPVEIRSRISEDVSFAVLAAALSAQCEGAGADSTPAEPRPADGLRAGCLSREPEAELPAYIHEFGLLLDVVHTPDTVRFTLHYDGGLFTDDFIRRLAANYRTLLLNACERPAAHVGDLALLSDEETRYLLADVNATSRPFPHSRTLHAHVEAQAARTPDAPAVEWRGAVLTYRELDDTANRIARALRSHGITGGARVGVSVARTHRTVCLLLAVHKLGCSYVPLDPAYPADRLSGIAATADMAAVVFDGDGDADVDWLGAIDAVPLPWRELWEKAASEDSAPLDIAVDSGATTHLIYTSGSTGLPKGVVISHRNVVALLAWAWDTYRPDEVSRTLFATSLNFDLSVFELWCPLTMGGCVVVVDNVLALTEGEEGGQLRPSLVNTVPSALSVLLQRSAVPDTTKVLNVAGEPLPKELVNAAFASTGAERLYNLYGPSEDTTYSTWKCFTGPTADTPTIGVPIHNTVAYLLDAHGRLVPRGVAGELHLGGDGLSSGYTNDPERTAAAFVPAPAHLPAGTLYRTGDLARWTEAGELYFMGRKDNQVKVRGFRIELGEIEAVLRETVGLRDVAALAVDRGDDTLLVCYVGLDGADIPRTRMSEHLRRKLPHYMQPAKIITEERLPQLPNGKVDRKALAARTVDWGVGVGAVEGAGFTSDDPDEATVAGVWSDLLGLARLSSDLDFFSVGGHSLLATLLAARLSDASGTPVRVAEIYGNRTLADQAGLIRRKRAGAADTADPTAEAGPEARLRAVAETLRESARGHGVPGAGAAVYLDGTLELTYYGVDDAEEGRARTAESRQRVTCVTKAVLAFVSLQLVDRGLVSLDEPLDRHLPQAFRRSDGRTVQVTLRQLLSHTSGIDDSYEVWHDTGFPDLDSYLATFGEYGQIFEPGEVFAYSACGTTIVAGLIEKLLGIPWRRAVNELLLRPLGIMEIPETLAEGGHYGGTVAAGYLWDTSAQDFVRHAPEQQTVADDAAGSFSVCLTLAELAKIALLALNDGVAEGGRRLLSAELAEQMRTPQTDVPGHHFMHAWGLGWLMFGPTAFGFNSNGSGHHNFIQIFPEQRSFLLLLANAYPVFGLYEDVLRSLTGEGLIRRGEPLGIALDDCVGLYGSDGYRLNVLRGAEHLRYEYAERRPDGTWEPLDEGDLVPSGAGGFSSMSEKNILKGSISFISAPGTGSDTPEFVRIGQRFVRRRSLNHE
ncbi:hypothetical protein GCM10022384_45540 [Streptomyces marokkonensis]|uniref:Carrier domain-containing protein n=1 Tax=Streptomyces marokkonensis TaxID=324855 RepID=A0ABP7R5Q0_9ACTN